MREGRSRHPLVEVTTGRSAHFQTQDLDATFLLHGSNQVQILHDGDRSHTPHGLQRRTTHENRLISIGKAHERDPQARQELHDAKRLGRRVKA